MLNRDKVKNGRKSGNVSRDKIMAFSYGNGKSTKGFNQGNDTMTMAF